MQAREANEEEMKGEELQPAHKFYEPSTPEEFDKICKVKKLVKIYFDNINKVNLSHCLPNYIQYFMIQEVGCS